MKYLIVLGDGMADEAIPSLDGKTPLQTALTPVMDFLAREGRCGMLDTVPKGFAPGSEIANMSLLGYDVEKQFEGRGSLEAASMGVEIAPGVMAARCNLICVENGRIKNHSAGHISNEEAAQLIAFLNKELSEEFKDGPDGLEGLRFCPGISYRHLLLMKGGDKRILCTPPHDVPGTLCSDVMVKALCPEAQATADKINRLILRSQELLPQHPVNQKRKAEGKDMANSIWPWSPGYRPSMRKMTELFPIQSGSVISAVDLIKGIGVYAGLESIEVEGATGLYDTNYEGKAQAAIEQLRLKDFVFLHIEASDEASHEGNIDLKIKTIEYLDRRVLQTVLEEVSTWKDAVTIAVLPDHPTYCRMRTHVAAPVPFLIWRNEAAAAEIPWQADEVEVYDEMAAMRGSYGLLKKDEFIQAVFGQR